MSYETLKSHKIVKMKLQFYNLNSFKETYYAFYFFVIQFVKKVLMLVKVEWKRFTPTEAPAESTYMS